MKLHAFGASCAAMLAVVATPAAAAETYARISTSKGDIIVALDAEKAPATVENFLRYATDGHYDRTLMHRIVAGFVIQGGGYSRAFTERPTRPPVKYEGDNGLKNVRGAIAMARTSDPQSAAAQWYINLRDNPGLDHQVNDLGPKYGYTVFGRVTAGMDVVDAIGAVATGPGGPFDAEVPVEPVVVNRIDAIPAPGGN